LALLWPSTHIIVMTTSNKPKPKPAVSASTLGSKRKRDLAPSFAIRTTAPGIKGSGTELLTHVSYTVDYLKERKCELSFQDIINYLSVQMSNESALNKFKHILQRAVGQVQYNPKGLNGVGSYKYKPVIPVENADDLKRYLQRRSHSIGVKFDDIKDGWPNALQGVNAMAEAGELLVARDKRDMPRAVWQSDSSLKREVADELKDAWHRIKMPTNPDDVREKLESAGLKPTSAPRQAVKATQYKDNRKRGPRKGGRQTNTHISHLLKDFSDRRK
jgi:transcription initiation factor TFIIE subunit beta